MRKIHVIIFLLLTACANGQNLDSMIKNDLIILKDSIWIKYKLWRLVETSNEFYIKDNMTENQVRFTDTMYFQDISFIDIPVFKLKTNAVDYKYASMIFPFLEKNNRVVSGLVIQNNKVVGDIISSIDGNFWKCNRIELGKNSPIDKIYEKVPLRYRNSIYTVPLLGEIGVQICYNHNDTSFIYDLYKNKFVSVDKYIREQNLLETIKKYAGKD